MSPDILFDDGSRTIPNATYKIRFAIYNRDRTERDPYPSYADSGSRIWEEEQEIKIINGSFNAYVGSVNALPEDLNFEQADTLA